MDALFSIQTLIMCFATFALVQIVKIGLDRAVGKEKRKGSFTHDAMFVGFLLPLSVGTLISVLAPVHPPSLLEYARTEFEGREWIVFVLWGMVIGQVTDYVVTKWKRVLKKWSEREDARKPEGA